MANQVNRLGPHSIEAEEAVLGSILINPEALPVCAFLEPGDFWEKKHGWIFETYKQMAAQGIDIDYMTVVEHLRNRRTPTNDVMLEAVGGPAYITYLINSTPTHIYAETYAKIVRIAAMRCNLLDASGKIAQLAIDSELEWPDLKAKVQTVLDDATGHNDYGDLMPVSEAVSTAMQEWETAVNDPKDVRGFALGFPHVDRYFAGFDPGWVISLIMPTNAGKTTVALQMVWQSLIHQSHILFVPTEMKPERIVNRLVSQALGLKRNALRTGKDGDPYEIMRTYEQLQRESLTFLESRRPTIQAVEQKARQLKRRLGSKFGVLVIDSASNIQNPDTKNIFDLTRSVINRIAALASDLHVLTVCTWQINRSSYGKMAVTSGRGGGDIENDSDFVFTFQSDELDYANGTKEAPADYKPQADGKRKAELICLKDRETGGTGTTFPFWFKPGLGFVPEEPERPAHVNLTNYKED